MPLQLEHESEAGSGQLGKEQCDSIARGRNPSNRGLRQGVQSFVQRFEIQLGDGAQGW